MADFNARMIDEFRGNGGETGMFGRTLVLLHTTGARSGEPRVTPLASLRDAAGSTGSDGGPGDDAAWLIAATWAGNERNPPWFHNLVAQPDVEIEVAGDDGVETVPVHATVLEGDERAAAWARFTESSEGFRSYEAKTTRVFPVIRLTRR